MTSTPPTTQSEVRTTLEELHGELGAEGILALQVELDRWLAARNHQAADTADTVLDRWEAEGPVVHQPTGIPQLDEMTGGGLPFGTRCYLLGAPDSGKTALLVQLADRWSDAGLVVGILAVDEEPGDLVGRLLQRRGWERKDCEQRDPDDIRTMRKQLGGGRIRLYNAGWTIEGAARDVAACATEAGIRGALMVDSVQTAICLSETPPTLPSPREGAAAAYDPLRDRLVLIGGNDGTTLTDTWEWDGATWTRVNTGQTQLMAGGSAAYDPGLGGVLYNLDNVNLIWNGTAWRSPTVGLPTGGDGHVLVYDPTSAGIMTQSGQYTRRFASGVGWQDVLISFGWSIRRYAMAIDPATGTAALVGGRSGQGGFGTFMWSGSAWSWTHQYNVGPGSSEEAAMVFDLVRNVFVHFGGENGTSSYSSDTWELSRVPLPPARYVEYGAGCGGSSSYVPALHADPLLGPRPVLGGSLMLRLEGMPPVQPVVGWYGVSRTAWGSVPLPLDLQVFAMSGCRLLASPDLLVTVGATAATGVAWWRTAIPNDVMLAGQIFFQQSAVLAPGANAPGVLWSNGGEGTIGGR